MLTRKHYETFAERFEQQVHELDMRLDSKIITQSEYDEAYKNLGELARRFAATFTWDNPRFDKTSFLKACGV